MLTLRKNRSLYAGATLRQKSAYAERWLRRPEPVFSRDGRGDERSSGWGRRPTARPPRVAARSRERLRLFRRLRPWSRGGAPPVALRDVPGVLSWARDLFHQMATSGVTVTEFDGSDDGRWHHRLTVTCDDRAGLLADLSEHLRAHDVDIVSAAVATDTESGHIVDSFAVCNPHRVSSPGLAALLAVRATRACISLKGQGQGQGCGAAAAAPLKPRRRERAAHAATRGRLRVRPGGSRARGPGCLHVAESCRRTALLCRFATPRPEAVCRLRHLSRCVTPCGRSPSAPCTQNAFQADQPPRLPPRRRPGLHAGPTVEGATRRFR